MLLSYALALSALSLLASVSCSSTPPQSFESMFQSLFWGRTSTGAVAARRPARTCGTVPTTTPTAIVVANEVVPTVVANAVLIEDQLTTNSTGEEFGPPCTVTGFDSGSQGGPGKGKGHTTSGDNTQTGKVQVYGQLPSGRNCGNLALIDAAIRGNVNDVISVLHYYTEEYFTENVPKLIAISEAIVRRKPEIVQTILDRFGVKAGWTKLVIAPALIYEDDASAALLLNTPFELKWESVRNVYLDLVIKYGNPDHVKALIRNNPGFSQDQMAEAQKFIFSYDRSKAGVSRARARSEDRARCGGDYYLNDWTDTAYFKNKSAVPESLKENFKGELGSVLLEAAFEGNAGLLRSFLESEFKFTFDPQAKFSALVNAAARGYFETVALIVKDGVELYCLNRALGMTNRNKHPQIFYCLLEAIEEKKPRPNQNRTGPDESLASAEQVAEK